ncbi:MAG: DUF1931 domain-containing protein [Candidatus Lokiarchaeota archaeon]|nr:DUF1931 domain-containing protein [Candidatus Lokiarchaeota archaeon]
MAKKPVVGKKPSSGGDVLFVKSKVRDYIKSKECNTSGDVIDGRVLNGRLIELLDKAVARAKANGRKTVQEKDL